MRKEVDPFAEVTRSPDGIALRLHRPVLIPDPRCVRPADERVVAHLVAAGPVTTEAVAETLKLPLRAVQALMRQLVQDGACHAVRAGRNIRYQVEDTTFHDASLRCPPQEA